MSKQNIYDNETFFSGYLNLRENVDSANNLEEKPAIFSMLHSLEGKNIIDLGCGYGENCRIFSDRQAEFVVGIDISHKMLEIAKSQNKAANIEYFNMPMEDIGLIGRTFDIAVSSLAMHYIKDYDEMMRQIHAILNPGGTFVFSQEHPLTTAPIAGAKWIKNEDGSVDHYRLTDYLRTGERSVSWIIDGVIKYHRPFSTLINGLVCAGFMIEEIAETAPTLEIIKRLPHYEKDLHKPNFLIIKAKKPESSNA